MAKDPDLDIGTESNSPTHRRQLAQDDFQQCRFARPIGSNNAPLFTPPDDPVQVLKQLLRSKSHGEALSFEDQVSRPMDFAKAGRHRLGLIRSLDCACLELLHLFEPTARLRGPLAIHEPPHIFIELGDLVLLSPGHGGLTLLISLTEHQILRVGARVGLDLAIPHLDHPLGDVLQENTVVRDEQDRPGIASEPAFEPLGGFEVKVVRRFVQDQQVGFFEQEPSEGQTRPLASAERSDRLLPLSGLKSHPLEDGLDASF